MLKRLRGFTTLRKVIVVLLALLVLAAGCGPGPAQPTEVPTPTPTEAAVEVLEDVLTTRDAALNYISQNYPEQAPAPDLAWEGGRTTPEGLVGSETYKYTADDWVVTISYPVVAPEYLVYQIVVENPTTGFKWEGELDAEGNLTETAAPTAGQLLTLEALKNAEYQSEWPADGVAKLTDGEYEEEIVPGAASKLVIVFYPDMYAFGDLDGDGVEDATVVLATSGGGSGTFISLEAVINNQGTPNHVATASLGDRVEVKSVAIEAGVITVDMVTHGPDDPLCCPTLEVTQKYELQGDELVELSNGG